MPDVNDFAPAPDEVQMAVRLPRELRREMRKFPRVNWHGFIASSIAEALPSLEAHTKFAEGAKRERRAPSEMAQALGVMSDDDGRHDDGANDDF